MVWKPEAKRPPERRADIRIIRVGVTREILHKSVNWFCLGLADGVVLLCSRNERQVAGR